MFSSVLVAKISHLLFLVSSNSTSVMQVQWLILQKKTVLY